MRGHGDNEQAANLTIEEGGTLLAVDSTITAHRNGTGGPNDFTEYKFEVYGSMILENCDVSKMWGLYDGYVIGPIEDTHSEVHGGIQIFSDDVTVQDVRKTKRKTRQVSGKLFSFFNRNAFFFFFQEKAKRKNGGFLY